MRALLQRVSSASLTVDGLHHTAALELALSCSLGVTEGDSVDDARHLVDKTVNLRVFPDDVKVDSTTRCWKSNGSLMVVSQFTLYADTRKGRRPSFVRAAQPEVAEPLYEQAVALFREACPTVVTGVFGGHMVVEIHNDGPVTLMLDSADRQLPRRGA